MTEMVRAEKRAIRRNAKGKSRDKYAYLFDHLDADRIAVAAMHEALSTCLAEPEGVKFSRLASIVGRSIVGEINLDRLRRTPGSAKLQFRMGKRFAHPRPADVNWFVRNAAQLDNAVNDRVGQIAAGAWLIWAMVQTASATGYDEFTLAFKHERRQVGNKQPAFIMLTEDCRRVIEGGASTRAWLRPIHQPMIIPPLPWTDRSRGGYTRTAIELVRHASPEHRRLLNDSDLSQIHDAVNALNSTTWGVDPCAVTAMDKAYAAGGEFGRMPPPNDKDIPPLPDAADEEERRRWGKKKGEIKRFNIRMRGERRRYTLLMDAARNALGRPVWMPHQLDFRGRCYPLPPYLQHQGNDLARAVLRFNKPRPVTDRARFWLKVHAANCCGVDKLSFEDRAAWVESQMDEFGRWVSDPLANQGWLYDAGGKPNDKTAWQALIAAHALFDGDTAARLPVQVDGTCNGLQHYAAIGLDPLGAVEVNLAPSDKPADVYTRVLHLVVDRLRADIAGSEHANIAKLLLPLVDRKVVKQPTMTVVYGVTRAGAKDQVRQALDRAGHELDEINKASIYLSGITLEAISKVNSAARQIMDWMVVVAGRISDAGEPVAWTTPLGLPVVQPYRKWASIKINTIMQQLIVSVPDDGVPVQPGKQVAGFAPNWIHSLDATHMMMTATACRQQGIAFAGVHDSFWTHAADVDTLNHALRDQFVRLHAPHQAQRLVDELRLKHPDLELPDPPARGAFKIESVRDSPYFFS